MFRRSEQAIAREITDGLAVVDVDRVVGIVEGDTDGVCRRTDRVLLLARAPAYTRGQVRPWSKGPDDLAKDRVTGGLIILPVEPVQHCILGPDTELGENERSAVQETELETSETFIREIDRADTLLIALPSYNFSVPAAFKAWLDLVIRTRRTFRYGA